MIQQASYGVSACGTSSTPVLTFCNRKNWNFDFSRPHLKKVCLINDIDDKSDMGAQIPAIAEKPLATSGCKKFQLAPLGDHLNTCTAHLGAKKAHDWMVDQVADLFHTTPKD